MPINEARREISLRMSVVARKLRKDFDRHMTDVGVTRSQWAMIAVASRRPGATQRQISELLEISEASAGRLIDRLCADGLLERRDQENDRRARCVFITDAAKPLLERLSEIGAQSEERLFKNFSDDELRDFGRLLSKVYANISVPD